MPDVVLKPAITSSNWGAFVQRVLEEIARARDEDADAVRRAACSAINYYRSHRFFFNEGYDLFYTVAGQSEYEEETSIGSRDGYPVDLIRPDIVRIDRDSGYAYTLDRIPFPVHRKDSSYITQEGFPAVWTWHHKTLFLWPAPNTADWEIQMDYIKDIGTPVYRYASGTWKYYERSTGNEIGDTWTSDWFKYAEPLIRCRVKRDLYTHQFTELKLAEAMATDEAQELFNLQAANDNFAQPARPEPWGT